VPTPPPPPDNKTDPWAHLRGSELWADIKGYAESRLKGAGARIKELEQQIAALDAGQLQLAQRSVQLEQIEGEVTGAIEALAGQLPEGARALVPADLPPPQRLRWLVTNYSALAGPAERVRTVDGSGGRRAAPAAKVNPGRKFLLGR